MIEVCVGLWRGWQHHRPRVTRAWRTGHTDGAHPRGGGLSEEHTDQKVDTRLAVRPEAGSGGLGWVGAAEHV